MTDAEWVAGIIVLFMVAGTFLLTLWVEWRYPTGPTREEPGERDLRD